MKFSYSWLKELVEIKQTPEKLAEFLSLHAFETEIAGDSKEFSGIIVAKVLKVEKHPNADRLRVVELTDGKNIIAPVVCGAFNFKAGAMVALALPGAAIPHDQYDAKGGSFTLTKATIRGVESQGMICSAKELGLGSDGSGIMVLDQTYRVGEKFGAKEQSNEILFDISIPANRPDLISYRGVAWEIAALTGGKYKVKHESSAKGGSASGGKPKISNLKSKILKIRISDPNLCKKYIGVRLGNIQVGPSPKFIQDRLKLSGLRPINNVVDITNYVMLEIGQPLHAFDAAYVAGAINVRRAYLNERIKTLDSVERKLTGDTLVIADSKKPLAIAGVIGGFESAVGEFTKEIILEAANFNAVSVRRTARSLGLRTDASARFEKSLPTGLAHMAAEYAAMLLVKYAQARPLEYAEAGIKKEKPTVVEFDPEKVNKLLGTKISASEQERILKRFGFLIHVSGSMIHVSVPFWRPDIKIWQDLAEEIVRFEGLDKISSIRPALSNSAQMSDPILALKDQVIDLLTGMGFDEVYTYSFVSEADLAKWQIDRKIAVEVANPLSADQEFLRPNLALNVLKTAEHNSRLAVEGNYFEIGNIYWKEKSTTIEKTYLFALSSNKTKVPEEKFLGAVQALAAHFGFEFEIRQNEEQMGDLFIDGKKAGSIGTIEVSELHWIGASIDFEELVKHIKPKQFKTISRFPTKELDVSILVKRDLPFEKIVDLIFKQAHKIITNVSYVEKYEGKNISPNKKSITFRIVYQAQDRTLTDEEVNKIHSQILNELKSKFNAEIRD